MRWRDWLTPLSPLYGSAVRARAAAYRRGVLPSRRLGGRVISVGNLTVGGTGKTPLVLWIAERLAAEGERAAILTRGYRGQSGGKNALEQRSAEGDEVQLLRARLGDRAAFGVGADRYASGRALESAGNRYFVLDDGFQHLRLARDLDIVLVDAMDPFGGGRLLPAGNLREPISALRRASAIVITRAAEPRPGLETKIRRYTNAPVFYARVLLDSIRAMGDAGYPGEEDPNPRGRKFFAFCGIGNPRAFIADLGRWGIPVTGSMFFRDHHRYNRRDADRIEAAGRRSGADALLCTEKDLFNLGAARPFACGLFYCRVSVSIEPEPAFWRMIKGENVR